MTTPTRLLRTAAQLHEAVGAQLSDVEPAKRSLGLIPTMGALHSGHQDLARAAVERDSVTVASIFVNPLQFGDATDLDRYPRDLDADLDALSAVGVDFAFAPELQEVYPNGEPTVRISAGPLGSVLEGASRPGHFDGALTVVAKLLHLAQPRVAAGYRAYFGQKDAQQLALVSLMVADLNFPVEIIGVPTVRDADGLALSSRNTFLDAEHRKAALVLSRALRMLESAAAAGQPLPIGRARALIDTEPLAQLDYLDVLEPRTFSRLQKDDAATVQPLDRPVLAVVAATVGPVRLIDNVLLTP